MSGLKEYIVVDTEDVLMICPRGEEQNIKKYIDEVKFNKGEDWFETIKKRRSLISETPALEYYMIGSWL